MAEIEADHTIRRWGELKTIRALYEPEWEEIAKFIRPQRSGFTGLPHEGAGRLKGVFSSTPMIAAEHLASGLYGTLTNQAEPWMSLTLPDPELADHKPVKLWLDTVSRLILNSFQPAFSPFYPASIQVFQDLVAFGNACSYDELRPEKQRIADLSISPAEICVDVDAFGEVVEAVRRFRVSGRAAVDLFGTRRLPPSILEAAEKGKADRFWFYHHVEPNRDWKSGALGPRGKPFRSRYVSEIERAVVATGGYEEMPFSYPRWSVDGGATYGQGAAFIALADARTLNLIEAANLEAGQRAARPPLLAPDRRALPYDVKATPGSVLYGAMTSGGRQLVQEMTIGRQTGLTLEMVERKSEQIRDALYWTLMQLVGRTGMTATEVLERQEEKLRLMAPYLGRSQHEYLVPKVQRRFGMLWRAGQLPPPPPEISGSRLEVKYRSIAALAAKSRDGAAITRLLADLTPLAQVTPRAFERLDVDALVEALAEARGVPASVLLSREEANAAAEARAQQEQMAQGLAMAEQGADVLQKLAAAGGAMEGAA